MTRHVRPAFAGLVLGLVLLAVYSPASVSADACDDLAMAGGDRTAEAAIAKLASIVNSASGYSEAQRTAAANGLRALETCVKLRVPPLPPEAVPAQPPPQVPAVELPQRQPEPVAGEAPKPVLPAADTPPPARSGGESRPSDPQPSPAPLDLEAPGATFAIEAFVEGTFVIRRGTRERQPLYPSDVLRPGDRIATGAGGVVLESRYGERHRIRLGPSGTYEIADRPEGGIVQRTGKAVYETVSDPPASEPTLLQKLKRRINPPRQGACARRVPMDCPAAIRGSLIQIETQYGTAEVTALGTKFSVEVFDEGAARVEVFEGAVEIASGGEAVIVSAGSVLSFRPGNVPGVPQSSGPSILQISAGVFVVLIAAGGILLAARPRRTQA